MRVSQSVIQNYIRRLTAGRGGSSLEPMKDLSQYDADILGLLRRAESDGNLEWLRLSFESLILNPKGRIGIFVGETYPYREDEMVILLSYAYKKCGRIEILRKLRRHPTSPLPPCQRKSGSQ